jgi:hypothetical protein
VPSANSGIPFAVCGRRPRAISFWSLVVGVLLAGVTAGADAKTKRYRGQIVGDSKTRVELVVRSPKRGRPDGSLTVKGLGMGCEDDTTTRISPEPIDLSFTSTTQFIGDRYTPAAGGAAEAFVGTHGSIVGKGNRAVGSILAFENPPDEGNPSALECSTQLDTKWRAHRVRGS